MIRRLLSCAMSAASDFRRRLRSYPNDSRQKGDRRNYSKLPKKEKKSHDDRPNVTRRKRNAEKHSELPKNAEQNNNDHQNHNRQKRDDKNHTEGEKNASLGFQQFDIRHKLGKGTYGKHYRSELQVMRKRKSKCENGLRMVDQEISILSQLKQLYGSFHDDSHDVLILEFAKRGTLYSLLFKKGHLTEHHTARYMSQLISAVEYLHGKGIVHRDIKPENVLLDANDVVKLADFGLAISLADLKSFGKYPSCGTVNYLAPEVFHHQGYDEKVDLWAIGIVMFRMIVGRLPFNHRSSKQVKERILHRKFFIPKYVSYNARDIISKLLESMPHMRMKLSELATHPWMIENEC
ncbi:Aurora kinase A [Trichinella murrelli]|uniref:Aurora kinase A n=1 Tax=Trichinella murrelli TaxID=144512 RepID=A0A0V0UHD7_9BILA|nr:Aurora kinase A [Trichinella murrelli]